MGRIPQKLVAATKHSKSPEVFGRRIKLSSKKNSHQVSLENKLKDGRSREGNGG